MIANDFSREFAVIDIDAFNRSVVPFAGWLLSSTLAAGAVAVLVLLLQMIFRRWLTPAWRHRLWWLVALRLVLPALPSNPISRWVPDFERRAKALFAQLSKPAPAADHVPSRPPTSPDEAHAYGPRVTVKLLGFEGSSTVADPTAGASSAAPALLVDSSPSNETDPRVAPPAGRPGDWPAALFAIWATGAALLLVRLIVANASLARRLRRSLPIADPTLLRLLAEGCAELGLRRQPKLLATDVV